MILSEMRNKKTQVIQTTESWDWVTTQFPGLREGCAWITFESIQACLDADVVESVDHIQHSKSNHAARIAHLVEKLRKGEGLDPVLIIAESSNHRYISDGAHRVRAYQFAGMTEEIPLIFIIKPSRGRRHATVRRDERVEPQGVRSCRESQPNSPSRNAGEGSPSKPVDKMSAPAV